MKVQCDKCEATYNIKDEKIPETAVKLRCKKCQNPILLDGKISTEKTTTTSSAQTERKEGNKITYSKKWSIAVLGFYVYSIIFNVVMSHYNPRIYAQNKLEYLFIALGYIAPVFVCALIVALVHFGLAKVFKRSVKFTKLAFCWYLVIAFPMHFYALIGNLLYFKANI